MPIHGRPLQVLSLLVEKPGEITTREELRNRLWPAGTFVDFDHSLHNAVTRLREVLGDSANSPRFIETLPRRGYRFIWPIQNGNERENDPDPRLSVSREKIPTTTSLAGPARLRWLAWVVGCLLLLAAAVYTVRVPRSPNQGFALTLLKLKQLTRLGDCTGAILSPHGEFVAYTRDESGRQSLWLKQIATGSDAQLIPPDLVRYWGMTFSPDGSYIYYVSSNYTSGGGAKQDGVLYRIGLIGGTAVKLKDKLDSPISFSPDGRNYAFVRENGSGQESTLILASLDGSVEKKIASRRLPDYLDFPSWSPDGKTIACVAASFKAPHRILFYALDGTGRKNSPVSVRDWGPVLKMEWMWDGLGLLLAAKERQAEESQLWRVSYPDGGVTRITNDLNGYSSISSAVSSHSLVTIQRTESSSIWIAPDGAAEQPKQLTPGAAHYPGLSLTPDGRIVYATNADGNSSIWIMGADGNQRRQLTRDGRFDHHPVASPDGRYLFFVGCKHDACDVWMMDSKGSHSTQLTHGIHVFNVSPVPGGKWIVYTAAGSSRWSTLWKIPIDGGQAVQLSDKLAHRPAVSPDGKWIACFQAAGQGDTQTAQPAIVILPSEGGPPQKTFQIATTVDYQAGLEWIRNGSALAYVDSRDGYSNIWSQPTDGRPASQLTGFKGDRLFEFEWNRDGTQLVYLRGMAQRDVVLLSPFE